VERTRFFQNIGLAALLKALPLSFRDVIEGQAISRVRCRRGGHVLEGGVLPLRAAEILRRALVLTRNPDASPIETAEAVTALRALNAVIAKAGVDPNHVGLIKSTEKERRCAA
jgi:hypothetical protein